MSEGVRDCKKFGKHCTRRRPGSLYCAVCVFIFMCLHMCVFCLCVCVCVPAQDKALSGGNGLSVELLAGCREVLREREVVQGLMGRCEEIAQKMSRDVTQVLESGTGSMEQPRILNDT